MFVYNFKPPQKCGGIKLGFYGMQNSVKANLLIFKPHTIEVII